MSDPDSWPIIQLMLSLVALSAAVLYVGVLVESSSPRDLSANRASLSSEVIASLLLCSLLLVWAISCLTQILSAAAEFVAPRDGQPNFLFTLLFVLGCILSMLFILTFCILLPFVWGRAHSETHKKFFMFLKPLLLLFLPFTALISLLLRPLRGSHGASGEHGSVSEEDLLNMVESVDNSDIDENQKEMIGNIFDLGDLTAEDIMTHRTELEALPVTATTEDIINTAVEFGYSRLPVYDGTLDNIIGIAYVKDLLPFVGKGTHSLDLKEILRPTIFVPESRRARELLFDFKQQKIQLAVVVDEYGGTAGIVTMEDILESIVGDIEDEYDEEEIYIIKNADGSLTCNGFAEVEDVFKAVGIDLLPEDIESDTIGGLLTALLARIPQKGEQPVVYYQDIALKALDVDERRIVSVLVQKKSHL